MPLLPTAGAPASSRPPVTGTGWETRGGEEPARAQALAGGGART